MTELQKEREERRLTTMLYVGSVLLLLVFLFVTYRNMSAYVNSVAKVRERNMALIELEGQLSSLRDAELGVRGYLLTGDSVFLEPYIMAQRRFRDHSARLRLLKSNAADSTVSVRIQQNAAELQRVWRKSINDRAGDALVPMLQESVLAGKQVMESIRGDADMLLAKWRKERDDLLIKERSDGVDAPFMLAIYSLLAIIATGLLFWRLTRTLSSNEQVRLALRTKVKALDNEVTQRAELQNLLQKVLNSSPTGIMSFSSMRDSSGRIVDFEFMSANAMAKTILGREDLEGKRLLTELPDHIDNGLFDAYVEVVEKDVPFIKEYHYSGFGPESWFRNHSVKLDDGFLVSFMDISEQKEAQQLNLEADRLELTSQITRTVAHEVRNPLTNIHLALEQLQDETVGLEEETGPYFKIIDRNLIRIGKLIREMLESSQKRELNLVPCDLMEVVNTVLRSVVDRLELQEMKSSVHIDPDLPQVLADCELLGLALTNIAVNAIEAMEPGVGELHFTVLRAPDAIVLEISDNGKGMAPEALQRLFEPFFTGRTGGLGLGLTAARSILLGHNIKLDVVSAVGAGTTFTLRFPKSIFVDAG